MSGAFPIATGHSVNQAQHGNSKSSGASGSMSAQSPVDSGNKPAADGNQQAKSSQAADQTSNTDKKTGKSQDKDKQAKAFPALFHSMMQDSDADMATAMQQAMTGKTMPGDNKDNAAQAAAAAAAAGMPMLAGENGKALPQINWSGVVGVADGKGASALALQGNQNQAMATPAINGKDLPDAMLKAQEQLVQAQLQGNGNGQNAFNAALNKEHGQGLNLAHQFLADSASLPQSQAVTAASNVHNILAHDMSGLGVVAAARGSDNAMQQINVPVQQPQWAQQLGDRVQWLLGQGLHQAAIHLNPPELGSLDVHIQMHGDQASVNFSSPHAVVRHALDAAIPRLREMMQETGLTLGDVNVSGQALAQQQSRDPHSHKGQNGRQISAIGGIEETSPTTSSAVARHLSANGMLDVYA